MDEEALEELEVYEDPEAVEYCTEACYDERHCRHDPDCVDSDCYRECIKSYHRGCA